jgi:transposase
MQIKTILNRVHPIKSFVYGHERWTEDGKGIEVEIHPRANSRPVCSQCGRKRPGYDTLPTRRFQFVPILGLMVFFLYARRRVDCPRCGVHVEDIPWALGKRPITKAYAWFLASWAKRMSWKEVAEVFHISWESVFRSVEMAVEWGRARMDLSEIHAIGIDEIAWRGSSAESVGVLVHRQIAEYMIQGDFKGSIGPKSEGFSDSS